MINLKTLMIEEAPTYIEGAKFLKTKFQSNEKRFLKRFAEPLDTWLSMNDVENRVDIVTFYVDLFKKVKPFTYQEAFSIEEDEFRATVFSVINVPEMVKNLGSERVKTEGISLSNKVYNEMKGEFEIKPFEQVYELHKVNCSKLGIDNTYAIKCWCTSTEEEHWLWISDEQAKNGSPLEAIASTCMVYKCMIGKIKHIIRQGDVFLFEMKDGYEKLTNLGEVIPLDKDTYFGLLKSQS